MVTFSSKFYRLKIAQRLGKACKKWVMHASKLVEKDVPTFKNLCKTHLRGAKTPHCVVHPLRQRGPTSHLHTKKHTPLPRTHEVRTDTFW
jgi:hypothetical protein